MKRFCEPTSHWRESKALEFLCNFVRNHKGTVNDNDTFGILAAIHPHEQWVDVLKAELPPTTLMRMQEHGIGRDRLDFNDETSEMLREAWQHDFARSRVRKLFVNEMEQELADNPASKYEQEPFPRRVRELQETLRLSDLELEVLLVCAFINGDLLTVADGHNRRSDTNDKNLFIAKCLDCDGGTVSAALAEKEKLRRYGCLDDDFDVCRDLNRFLNGVSSEPLVNSYFQRCKEEALPWDFYGELAVKHGAMLKRLLASGDGSAPVNLLFYGAPGTGKTSFAKTLAAELKRDCYLIAQNTEASSNGRCTCTPEFRFGALQVCANQIEPERSIIIVDEADDMLRGGRMGIFGLFFGGGSVPAGDKGMLNSVLDSVRVPTIWITNTPAEVLDPSSRRRFDYSVKFAPLTHAQREAIWHNNVSKMKLESLVSNDLQSQLAADYPVSAGGITLALQNLSRLSPAPEEAAPLLEKLLTPHCELLEIPRVNDKLLPAKDYSLEGLNIKGNLTLPRVVEAIRNFQQGPQTGIDRPRMNLLLSGAPGTGKTEFVKYLGSILRTKVVVRMGSDLLNMYVGGTEQRIKAAFEQAEAEKAILLLDEIDGMVQTRERAQRSWEVTQVNELLHQMENFNGVMIGATNFAANLDPAVLRRFTFKLEFDYLNEAGKRHFFERMFQTSLLPEELVELAQIPNLTPGDFRTVRQSFFYLGSGVTNRERLDALRQESEGKHRQNTISGSGEKKIGF